MRILITGLTAFVIWGIFSTWLYVDILKPGLKKPVIQAVQPQPANSVADSLAEIYALMPKDLLICFDFNKAKFDADPQIVAGLSEFRSWLDKYPGSKLLITGYTDLVGTPEYNHDLGLKRAEVVQKYLESIGFPASRMIITSKGENDPIADYITPEGRAKNRRTQISIEK